MILARIRSLWAVLAFMLVLTGCSGPEPVVMEPGVINLRQGRFALQVKGGLNQPDNSVQGNFAWRRLSQEWQLDLSTPLGTTLARLNVTPTGASLQRPDAQPERARSAQDLLVAVFGAKVPVDALEDWIDGRVVQAGVTDVKRDSLGRITGFSQAGWRVGFERYGQQGPNLIRVSGVQDGREVELRLSIDQRSP